jgi:hypothetical protein
MGRAIRRLGYILNTYYNEKLKTDHNMSIQPAGIIRFSITGERIQHQQASTQLTFMMGYQK